MSSDVPRIYVFYDYVCPYAYVGKLRADELERRYDVQIEWIPWEIYPDAVPAGETIDWEPPEDYASWAESLAGELDEELDGPEVAVNSNLALRGAEYAKDQGREVFEAYHAAVFEAIWSNGQNIGDIDVLRAMARGAGMDPEAFEEGIQHNAYQYRLDLIDEIAEGELGIKRVPTFVFGDQRIVGNDRFEPSLLRPLEAFLERRKQIGEDWTSTLEHDADLARLL